MNNCDGCLGVCCVIAGEVTLRGDDVARITAFTGRVVPYRAHSGHSISGPSDPSEPHEVAVLKEHFERCRFQEPNGRCGIYPARPRDCREYACWDRRDVSYEVATRLHGAGIRSGRLTAATGGGVLRLEISR